MFFQLGSIVFQNLFSPHSLSVEGDEAVYAEHELLGGKPRLQKTGDTLQQITLECKFHAEFCNPAEQIALVKAAKDAGTILPMLLGNGKYVNDYVIISYPYEGKDYFADGTLKEAIVTITIREYVSYNQLEQQQLAARKAAFAVGDKHPVIQRPPQPVGEPKIVAMSISATLQQAGRIEDLVSDYKNNTAQRQSIGTRIREAVQKGQDAINTLNTQLDKARKIDDKYKSIRSNAASVYASLNAMKALYPITSLSSLQSVNVLLQGNVSSFSNSSSGLMSIVATRQPGPL